MKDCDEGNEPETHDNNHSLHMHTGRCQSGTPKSAARHKPFGADYGSGAARCTLTGWNLMPGDSSV